MSSLEYALEAVAALTLVDRSLIDYRDLSVDFHSTPYAFSEET